MKWEKDAEKRIHYLKNMSSFPEIFTHPYLEEQKKKSIISKIIIKEEESFISYNHLMLPPPSGDNSMFSDFTPPQSGGKVNRPISLPNTV